MTDQYSRGNGVYLLDLPLASGTITLPKLMQQAGYQTGLFGKWHVVNRPTGFDDYRILKRQGRCQNTKFLLPGIEGLQSITGWSTAVITDLTIDFTRR